MAARKRPQKKNRKILGETSYENFTPNTGIAKVGNPDEELTITQEQLDAALMFTHLLLGVSPGIDPHIACTLLAEAFSKAASEGLTNDEALDLGQLIAQTVYGPLSDPNAAEH